MPCNNPEDGIIYFRANIQLNCNYILHDRAYLWPQEGQKWVLRIYGMMTDREKQRLQKKSAFVALYPISSEVQN
jgi:hypothetical protein